MPQGLDKPFVLTPRTGPRMREVEYLADAANLNGALTGYHVMETSMGRNIEKMLQLASTRRAIAADHGNITVDRAPVAEGMKLRVNPTNVMLNGERFALRGVEADASQLLDLSALAAGTYAVVIETWRALVGPTSFNQATEPPQPVGATDIAHKPSALALYPSGNVDLSTGGVPDKPLVTHTFITQKFEQRQYRVRVIPDMALRDYQSDLIPVIPVYADTPQGPTQRAGAYQPIGQYLHAVDLPDLPISYATAYDRRIEAFKICLVTVANGGLTVACSTLDNPTVESVLVLPSLRALGTLLVTRIQDLQARVAALEANQGTYMAGTMAPYGLADRDNNGSGAAQTIHFGDGSGALAVTHDLTTYPSRFVVTRACELTMSASATFAASTLGGVRGLRILVNGQFTGFAASASAVSGELMDVSVTGLVRLSAGDYVEVEGYQTSGAVLNVQRATIALSR